MNLGVAVSHVAVLAMLQQDDIRGRQVIVLFETRDPVNRGFLSIFMESLLRDLPYPRTHPGHV